MHLRKIVYEQDARETELRTQLAETERRLIVVTRDLEESRSFVAKEDSDAKELITAFNDVNEAVDDLAYLISEAFDQHDLSFALADETIRPALAVVPDFLKSLLKVSYKNDGAVEDVLGPMICCLLHCNLFQHIFALWSPGISSGRHHACLSLYELVRAREPQDRAARWRSMTYQNCDPGRDDARLAATIAETFFELLAASVKPLLPESSTFDFTALAAKFTSTVNKIALNAIRLQDKAKATYLSFDYEFFLAQYGVPFERTTYEASDKVTHWKFQRSSDTIPAGEYQDIILAPTALGLLATKGTLGPKGEISRSVKVVMRAKALVGRCTYVPRSPTKDEPPPNQE
ncbi:hypothetical protein EXIGLDRAFT_721310 [Exidia glandulosa HHB12029]|uniref:Uncharacterized protein n=1 Tax=Exidia glandulosa HHB12029 TaxID=1314781 RepID=A0A166BF95_EXIGL|nr:hypothetical protein EXIGLDRAFT_721310 [Exidia glandulosa HHB12029]